VIQGVSENIGRLEIETASKERETIGSERDLTEGQEQEPGPVPHAEQTPK